MIRFIVSTLVSFILVLIIESSAALDVPYRKEGEGEKLYGFLKTGRINPFSPTLAKTNNLKKKTTS